MKTGLVLCIIWYVMPLTLLIVMADTKKILAAVMCRVCELFLYKYF